MTTQSEQQHQLAQAYKSIFIYSPEGQMIFADMLKASDLFTITGVRPNEELQHMEGARDMVRRIVQILGLSEEQLMAIALGNVEPTEQGEFGNE